MSQVKFVAFRNNSHAYIFFKITLHLHTAITDKHISKSMYLNYFSLKYILTCSM